MTESKFIGRYLRADTIYSSIVFLLCLAKIIFFLLSLHTNKIRMTQRLNIFLGLLSHYKYFIVFVIGVLLVGFVGDASYMKRVKLGMQIDEIQSEIDRYNTQYESDSRQLQELKKNPRYIEKIARERYFMKSDEEDIYVLSDDETNSEDKKDETTE